MSGGCSVETKSIRHMSLIYHRFLICTALSSISMTMINVHGELSCPGNRNVPNAEGRNAFPERSEHAVLIHPSSAMTVTAAGGGKIFAILPLKCAIFSGNQAFSGHATCSSATDRQTRRPRQNDAHENGFSEPQPHHDDHDLG